MPNPLFDALFAPHVDSQASFLHVPGRADPIRYGDFLAMAARAAHALSALGLEPGDRMAVQVGKSPEALALYAACVQAGVIYLPLNTAYTAAEVSYFVEDSGARLVICAPGAETDLRPIADRLGARLETLDDAGQGSFAALCAGRPDRFDVVDRKPGDLAAFLYTSGTTGRSKGAMLTQDNLLSNARTLAELWRFSERDVLLHALPIFHTHGLFVASNIVLLTGGAMIFLPKFDVGQMMAALPMATTMMGVPTFYTRLLDEPGFDRAATAHMRLFVSGSAPLLAETHVAFESRTGHRILERYGMTETNMNTSNPYDGDRRAGTVGFALPGVELKVTDPTSGATLPDGEIGQIEVRGPNVFAGYWNMPEKTAEELRADGFFITGDLGLIDGDGYVTIVGRNKDLIISGGYNIYPKEIELLIDELEGINESAVIGVPHPDFGEAVVAVVVAQSGAETSSADIMAGIKDDLARFKQPKRIDFVESLPRNAMGKVQKNVLREMYAGTFR